MQKWQQVFVFISNRQFLTEKIVLFSMLIVSHYQSIKLGVMDIFSYVKF